MTIPGPPARQWQSHASADTRQAWQDGYNRGVAAERNRILTRLGSLGDALHAAITSAQADLLGDTGSQEARDA